MRQIDLNQSLKVFFDPLHSLTHPNMDEWNYGGGWEHDPLQFDPYLTMMHSLKETDVLTLDIFKKAVAILKKPKTMIKWKHSRSAFYDQFEDLK